MDKRNSVQITMLNSMAGQDFIESLDTQQSWGISVLDLKDCIFDKPISDLTEVEAHRAVGEMNKRGMTVYCMSTMLFHDDIEKGEEYFRINHLGKMKNTLQIANVLQPKVIRLIAAKSSNWSATVNSIDYIERVHPWLLTMYREAIDEINEAGFEATIENESRQCILSNTKEITRFFDLLDRKNKVYFTYDVQNLWQMGTYPSLEVYHELKDYIGFFHLKGGQSSAPESPLEWRSSLEDATWPVVEITQQVVGDGVSPVICLNPSHGKRKEGYDYDHVAKLDLDYIRNQIKGVN